MTSSPIAPLASDATLSPEVDNPAPILGLAMNFMASKHLFVASAIGLFESLGDGPITLEEVAARCKVPRRTTRIVADAMVALGLVERGGDRYENAPVAQHFLAGRTPNDLRPLLRFFDRMSYPAWAPLEQAVRSDSASTRHGGFDEEAQRIFSEGVEALTRGAAHALATSGVLNEHGRLLDLGGGTGSFLLAALREHPTMRGTLFELPAVASVARHRLDAELNRGAVEIVSGDFFVDPLPAGQDLVLMANVIHLFSPDQNWELLRRVRAAMEPGGRLLLVDFWTDPTHTQPLAAALLAGEFLMIAGAGDTYSEHEARGWLHACGWQPIAHRPLAGAASLLIAEAV